eukprot:159877-Rhodomonas_salina.3
MPPPYLPSQSRSKTPPRVFPPGRPTLSSPLRRSRTSAASRSKPVAHHRQMTAARVVRSRTQRRVKTTCTNFMPPGGFNCPNSPHPANADKICVSIQSNALELCNRTS